MLFFRPFDLGNVLALVLAMGGLVIAGAAGAQTPCSASNMTGMWKLISEESVAAPNGGASDTAVPAAEYLEVRSGLLFWVTQPTGGARTRDRHTVFFSGSTVDVRPPIAKAPEIIRCTLTGRRMVLLTSGSGSDGNQRRGRLEFRKTGR